MSQTKRIFIIGHPGAGKALLAKTLAEKLGWKFIDIDFGLEFNMGQTIENILGKEGHKHFLEKQLEILRQLQSQDNIVVTTDASIATSDAIQHLLANEFVVFLNASTSVQASRVSRDPQPILLKNDLATFFDELHRLRDTHFEALANININSDDNALDEHVQIILENIANVNIQDSIVLENKDMVIMHHTLHKPVELTKQQALCLKLLAHGKSSKEIAKLLNISYRTVEGHIERLIKILGCSSSKDLIKLYFYKP